MLGDTGAVIRFLELNDVDACAAILGRLPQWFGAHPWYPMVVDRPAATMAAGSLVGEQALATLRLAGRTASIDSLVDQAVP